MERLIHSSKFWMAVLDAGVSSLAIVLGWFLIPEKVEQVMLLVGLWQPVVVAVIAGIAYEDGKEKAATLYMRAEPEPANPELPDFNE